MYHHDSYVLFSPSESADSDDEIIVKTLWPVHQAPSTDNKGLDYKDQDRDIQCSTENTSNNDIQIEDDLKGNGEAGNKEKFEVDEADKAGGNSSAEDEVFEKVQRDRMKFPCSSECNSSAPTKSRLDDHSSKSVEHSHHNPEQGTTKANHKGN